MSLVGGIVAYVLIWWLVLFMVLPWSVNREDRAARGHDPGAPVRPRLLLKFAITTAITTVVFVAVYAVAESGLVSLRG